MAITAAKRRDLVVVHTKSSYWVNGANGERGHSETSEGFAVGVVTSVTREGIVKRWRQAGDFQETDHLGRPYRGQELPRVGFVASYIIPAAQIDVAGALATAATDTYDSSPTQTRAAGSLDAVRAALRPHLRQSAGWDVLATAAAEWESARRAQDAAWTAARVPTGPGWLAAYEAHCDVIRAVNGTYRAAYAAAAGETRAA